MRMLPAYGKTSHLQDTHLSRSAEDSKDAMTRVMDFPAYYLLWDLHWGPLDSYIQYYSSRLQHHRLGINRFLANTTTYIVSGKVSQWDTYFHSNMTE